MSPDDAQRELDDALRWLMADPRGRLILDDLLTLTGAVVPGGPAEAHFLAYREGMRAVGLQYLQRVNMLCPEKLLLMQREHDARSDSEPARGGSHARARSDRSG